MPFSGGTFTRTDGVRSGPTVWQQAQAAGVGIVSQGADTHDQDIATGLNNCMLRDGTSAAAASQNMGNNKIINLANGTASTDAMAFGQFFPSGTTMIFVQAAAPPGWTQVTTWNDAALRIVSGTGGGANTGGQTFSSAKASGTVDGHALTSDENGPHTHGVTDPAHFHVDTGSQVNVQVASGPTAFELFSGTHNTSPATTGITIQSAGMGTAHTHTFTSGALNINYVDSVVASRD